MSAAWKDVWCTRRGVLSAVAVFMAGGVVGWSGHGFAASYGEAQREIADVLGLQGENVGGRVPKGAEAPFKQITLERVRGLCPCADYQVTFRISGVVLYEGRAFVPRLGRHHGAVPPRHFVLLAVAAERLRLADFDGEVIPDIDGSYWVITLVTREGVRYRLQRPSLTERPGLEEFIAAMDRLLDEVTWGQQHRR